ncbi:MAG: small subunit ribosomal protein [Solirubrobacteraceae bacterium]|nr:small subunit ribosomal protein [Solirubrobacteraceae bacterium]
MTPEQPPDDEPRADNGEETPEAPVSEETPAAPEAPPEPEPEAASDTSANEPEGEPAAPEPTAEAPTPPPDTDEEAEAAPRSKPEIPGADLVPDIVLESGEEAPSDEADEFDPDAEPTAGEDEEPDEDAYVQPIAGATIDLAKDARYTATGKRKTAVARVILKPGTGEYRVNGKPLNDFFPRPTLQRVIRQPLETVGYESRMDVVAALHGGGVSAQAGALRHGVARALIEADPNLRGELKRRGFLTRDPRVKERKKAGLKKARKRPQFSKR